MPQTRAHSDDGFSLVEVVIAMFLVGVLALAVLPLMIGAARLSVTNSDLGAANAFASATLAPIRDEFPVNPVTPRTCDQLRARVAHDISDPAGTGLLADVAVGRCDTGRVGTAAVTVTVREGAKTLVTLDTLVLVGTP